jgi:predicted GIY-YIG superfamily endonuclease
MELTNKYNNGIIYKLQCLDNHYYIGATIAGIKHRFACHKSLAKTNTSKVYTHINKIGWENVKIEVIENYSCNSKKELNIREDYYIEKAKDDLSDINAKNIIESQDSQIKFLETYIKGHGG